MFVFAGEIKAAVFKIAKLTIDNSKIGIDATSANKPFFLFSGKISGLTLD